MDRLTTDQAAELTRALVAMAASEQAEALAAIEADEVSDRQQTLMNHAIEAGGYTTTALVAMAAWLLDMGDVKGQMMVLAFAGEFARHEAVTL